jgi:roadblock/LC7 domain-containing protein
MERAEMNELDDLVSRHGVIMTGQLGPDGRVAEHKSESLFIENPAMLEMAHWFVAAVNMMLTSMGSALDQLTVAGTWLPTTGFTYRGGDYAIAIVGANFVVAESAKIESLDELAGMLRQLDS